MTKNETAKILEMAFDSYPNTPIKDPARMIETWTGLLEKREYKDADAAMKRICAREKYFPTVAELLQEIGPDWSEWK